ncbi:MAG: hypothetical protein WAX14_17415 [Rhodococcus sp. (in: high G+C Gram-positive bacteria)]|uniref:hypothetical protein n=1 Tax=Rhodococcus sp. TaxID=1831 RepID=UPI003BB5F28F
MTTIADLEHRLVELYATPDDHAGIETASLTLIAAVLQEKVPAATHLLLDWSGHGPHHELDDVTAADGTSLRAEVERAAGDVATWVTNLRGALAARFEPINPAGGVYRVELAQFRS